MHERTRRQLCRLVFIALCVLPTVITSSWAGYRISPFFAAAQRAVWEDLLLERTGLIAKVNDVVQPTGGSVLLSGVELIDPDGGEQVVRIRQIEIAPTAQGYVVLLSQPQIAQGKFLRLWDTLHDRVMRGPPPASGIQVSAGELTVEIGQRAQTFTHLRCTVEPSEAGVRALVDFQLAGIEMASPAQLRIDRNRQITPPTTSWLFHTDMPVPCNLFQDYLPGIACLGNNCQFRGTVTTVLTRDDWSAEVSGRFSGINLDRVTRSLPDKIAGSAELGLNRAVFQHGQLQAASGQLLAEGGVISTALLRSLREQFRGSSSINVMRSTRQYVEYDRLAFEFDFSAGDMMIVGRCTDDQRGVVLCTHNEELLTINPAAQQSLLALVRALSPPSDVLVPATEASKGILGILTLPSVHTSTPSVARPPRARLRFD